MKASPTYLIVYPASHQTATSQEFASYGAAHRVLHLFSMASIWTKKRWAKHMWKNRICVCPRQTAAKAINELMNKEHRATLGQYRERLKMVHREVTTLAWNRVRTDVPGFAISY